MIQVARISLPFQPRWRPAVLAGTKTSTVRAHRFGAVGDDLVVEGAPFEFTVVVAMRLSDARDSLWREEGMASPEEFQAVWIENHPTRGFRGEDQVWAHQFRRVA